MTKLMPRRKVTLTTGIEGEVRSTERMAWEPRNREVLPHKTRCHFLRGNAKLVVGMFTLLGMRFVSMRK